MKKLFTLSLFLLTSAWTMAQDSNTFQFVDKEGNVVADGTTINRSELVDDPFGEYYISTGLYVKNTTGDKVNMRVAYQIETMDNGEFQICFPVNCVRKSVTGSYTTTSGSLDAGTVSNLQCEWFPVAYGSCRARLTIEVLNALGSKTADGPTVTVAFNYADPSGIVGIHHASAVPQQYFSADGREENRPLRGLNIIRMTDGTVVKQFNK